MQFYGATQGLSMQTNDPNTVASIPQFLKSTQYKYKYTQNTNARPKNRRTTDIFILFIPYFTPSTDYITALQVTPLSVIGLHCGKIAMMMIIITI